MTHAERFYRRLKKQDEEKRREEVKHLKKIATLWRITSDLWDAKLKIAQEK